MAASDEPLRPAEAPEEDGPVCPSCGYDLRGTVGDRCSECGGVFDRALLGRSGVPWARRKEIGRVRAYVSTVWLVAIGSRRLASEGSRAQDLWDGRAFRRVTAGLVSVVLVGLFGMMIWAAGGMEFLVVQPPSIWGSQPGPEAWVFDLVVPWSAGATIPVVLPVMLSLLAVHVTGIQRRVFRDGTLTGKRQGRLYALSYYTAAPLALLAVAGVFMSMGMHSGSRVDFRELTFSVGGVAGLMVSGGVVLAAMIRLMQWFGRERGGGTRRWLSVAVAWLWLVAAGLGIHAALTLLELGARSAESQGVLFVAAGLVAVVAVGLCYVRTAQWVVRARHVGWEIGLWAMIRLGGLWLVGGLFWLGFGTWCVGFVWIVIDSFL